MIGKDYFNDTFQEQAELYGWRITDKRAKKIYYTLNEDGFLEEDLRYALSRYERDDFKFADFQSMIRTIRAERLEREAMERQQQEEEAIRKWFREHRGERVECIFNGDCGLCKRTYCDYLASHVTKAIKDILQGERPSDEVHIELASKFRGIGFEMGTGMEAF